MTLKTKILYLVSFIFFVCTSFPSPAEACGVCMITLFDWLLPPVFVWCIFITVWFLIVSALESLRQFVYSLLIVLVLFVLFFMFLGPVAVLPLFLYALIKSIAAFFNFGKKTNLQHLRIGVGVCGILIIVGLSVYSYTIKSSRNITEYILQHESVHGGNVALNSLIAGGAKSLPDLRILVQKSSDPDTLEKIVASLGRFGEPGTDVPLLINVLRSSVIYDDRLINDSLRKLSGIRMKQDSSAEIWEKAWQDKLLQKK